MKGAVSTVVLLLTVAVIATVLVYNYSIPIEKPTLRQKIVTGRAISDIPTTAPSVCTTYYQDSVCDAPDAECPQGTFVSSGAYPSIPGCNECQTGGFDCKITAGQPSTTVSGVPSNCESYGLSTDKICDDAEEICKSGFVPGGPPKGSEPECKECSTGKWKDCKGITTKTAAPLTKLQSPTNLQCSDINDNSIHITWPVSTGDSSYRLEWCEEGVSFGSQPYDVSTCGFTTTEETNAWAIGLKPNIKYSFRVRAESTEPLSIDLNEINPEVISSKWSEISCKTATPIPAPSGYGEIKEMSFYSNALKSEKKYNVYLPSSYYSSSKKYPVLYLLHGANDNDHNTWIKKGHIDKTLERLSKENKLEEIIFIMPNTDDSALENGCSGFFAKNIQLRSCGNYEDYIVNDLIPYIEKKSDYKDRIIGTTESRGILGFSTGAHGAYWIAFKKPELFSFVAGYSGFYQTYSLIDPIVIKLFSEVKIPKKEEISHMKLHLEVGEFDPLSGPQTEKFHERLKKAGIEHTYTVTSAGFNVLHIHGWGYFSENYFKGILAFNKEVAQPVLVAKK